MSTFPLIARKSIIGSLQTSNKSRLILFYGIIYSFSQISVLKMLSVDYEVHGRVQGVFFRKHTQKRAKELGLTGWVENSPTGTVVGQMEGNEANVQEMKQWLQKVGSPQSRIDKCEFKNEKPISKKYFKEFSVKR